MEDWPFHKLELLYAGGHFEEQFSSGRPLEPQEVHSQWESSINSALEKGFAPYPSVPTLGFLVRPASSSPPASPAVESLSPSRWPNASPDRETEQNLRPCE